MKTRPFVQLITLFTVPVLLIFGCTPEPKPTEEESKEPEAEVRTFIPEFQKALDAHGGYEKWLSYGTMEYLRNDSETHLIDLQNRKVRVTKDTVYTVGFDGKDVWVAPDLAAFDDNSARFFHNLHFYFFSLPFVAADPGANQEYLGTKTVDSVSYDVVKITFGENVGDAPEDQYLLYLDEESGLLQFINYSVTYYDSSRATQYHAMKYLGWAEVSGLMLPTGYAGYKWEAGQFGEYRFETSFSDVKLTEPSPNQELFEKPTEAEIESVSAN